MKRQVKYLFAGLLLLFALTGCQKEEIGPENIPTNETYVVDFRSSAAEEAVMNSIDNLRATVEALMADGTLSGAQGNGVLNRLDKIEKKFLKGQKVVVLNLINALSNHLQSLEAAEVISESDYAELLEKIEDLSEAINPDCNNVFGPIAVNGLNLNLPPAGSATIMPELFNAIDYGACEDELIFSFSEDPEDRWLTLDCTNTGQNIVRMWMTRPDGWSDYAETVIYVQDNFDLCEGGIPGEECTPVAIAYSSLSIAVGETPLNLPASSMDAGSQDLCETGTLIFTARRQGADEPPAKFITFYSEDSGNPIPVELWVSDGTHSAKVVLYVEVYAVNEL